MRILTVLSLQTVFGLMIYANVLVGSVPHQGRKVIFRPSTSTSIIHRFPITIETRLLVVARPSNVAIHQLLMAIVTVMMSRFLFPMLYLNFIANIPVSISRSTCHSLRSWESFMWKVLQPLMRSTLFRMELPKEQYSHFY